MPRSAPRARRARRARGPRDSAMRRWTIRRARPRRRTPRRRRGRRRSARAGRTRHGRSGRRRPEGPAPRAAQPRSGAGADGSVNAPAQPAASLLDLPDVLVALRGVTGRPARTAVVDGLHLEPVLALVQMPVLLGGVALLVVPAIELALRVYVRELVPRVGLDVEREPHLPRVRRGQLPELDVVDLRLVVVGHRVPSGADAVAAP